VEFGGAFFCVSVCVGAVAESDGTFRGTDEGDVFFFCFFFVVAGLGTVAGSDLEVALLLLLLGDDGVTVTTFFEGGYLGCCLWLVLLDG